MKIPAFPGNNQKYIPKKEAGCFQFMKITSFLRLISIG